MSSHHFVCLSGYHKKTTKKNRNLDLGLFAFVAENLTTENVQSTGKVTLVQKSFAKVLGIAVWESSFSNSN